MRVELLLMLFFLSPALRAQTVVVAGRVRESGSNNPVIRATVRLVNADDTGIVRSTPTDLRGRFTLQHLPPGRYRISVTSIGYKQTPDVSLTVGEGDTAGSNSSGLSALNFDLEPEPINMEGVVVSASRTPEKAIEAPASVTLIDAKEISEQPAVTPIDHVRSTAGVDVVQTGVAQQSVVVRGFNNVASTSLTILTDNRIAAIPSLRINVPAFIPLVDDDIDRIEVVRGPASALYGPNATQGVVNIISRSPLASQGTSISLTGGNQSLAQIAVRHSGLLGEHIGYKISARYFRAQDWEYADPIELRNRDSARALGATGDALRIGGREPFVERFAAEARVDMNLGSELLLNGTAGVNQDVRSIELTDLGAVQAKDWRYTYFQARASYKDLFLQAYLNLNNAGTTYWLQTGAPVVDRSTQFVAQAQHAYSFGDRQRFTYGMDVLLTRPVTDGTITGRNENSDHINEFGGYLQSETHVIEHFLDLVLAGRIDGNSELVDPVFSPRAAVVFKPWQNQSFRLTFNRAYSTPSTSDLFLDIVVDPNVFHFPDAFSGYDFALRGSGVPKNGFTFSRNGSGRPLMYSPFASDRNIPGPVDDAVLYWPVIQQILQGSYGKDISNVPQPTSQQIHPQMAIVNTSTGGFDPVEGPTDISPLKPTITQTVELGYSGAVESKLQAGVDLYFTKVTNFISQLQVITPNVFLNPGDVKLYLLQHGLSESEATTDASIIGTIPLGTITPQGAADPTALIAAPRNFGTVDVAGIDLSLEYFLDDHFSIAGTYSHLDRNFFEKLDAGTDFSLNAPKDKASLTMRYHSTGAGLFAELRDRWIGGFLMNSGIYAGTINPYSLLDALIGYTFPGFTNVTLTLSGTNILDHTHQEFIGAPEIGRLLMARIVYNLQ
jgi:outer membrane receptor for ferrienterochelin and colicins